jgi:hypothetical protein
VRKYRTTTFFQIFHFPLIPKKIEMILLLPAEYSHTTEQMNAEQFNNIIKQQQEEIERLRKENEELKSQRPKHTCPQDEDLTGGDANYQYYYAVDDGDMTIWKVPRHLAEVKSAKTSYHGAVEQSFYDEGFGEEYGKLTYLIVREMKLKDLVKRKWKPAAGT